MNFKYNIFFQNSYWSGYFTIFFFFQIKKLVSLHLHEAQRRQHGGDHQDPRRVGRHSLGGPAATAAVRIRAKAAYNSYRNVLKT